MLQWGVMKQRQSVVHRRGFTLIELLVVIAIIGLLASVVIASLSSARAKGRDARRLSDLRSAGNAIELARTGTNSYNFAGCVGADVRASTCTIPDLSDYKDPSGSTTACTSASVASCDYSVSNASGGIGAAVDNYQICAYLESGSGGLPAGRVSIRSNTNSTAVVGCL